MQAHVIRVFTEPPDSMSELTMLLHRAYKPLADAGMNFTAAAQSEAVTRQRLGNGECYVAVDSESRIKGTALLMVNIQKSPSPWYSRQGVAVLGQFAVEPDLQRTGLGSRLIRQLEERARELGVRELALDTADVAQHLIDYYRRRDFRYVETVQVPGKTYQSVILSKPL